MTTYELPPEPPIGESVQDALGRTWKHEGDRWALKDDADGPDTRSWRQLFLSAPLTLVEPEPWPTHELIVASIGERREVLARNEGGGYESPITSAWKGGPTLSDIVPVTVVPVAGLDELRACIKALGYDGIQTRGMPGSLLDTTIRLIEATDALGVDEG